MGVRRCEVLAQCIQLRRRYENVIALELMNEPLLGGLPNLCTCLSTWRQILTFQGDVLEATWGRILAW